MHPLSWYITNGIREEIHTIRAGAFIENTKEQRKSVHVALHYPFCVFIRYLNLFFFTLIVQEKLQRLFLPNRNPYFAIRVILFVFIHFSKRKSRGLDYFIIRRGQPF